MTSSEAVQVKSIITSLLVSNPKRASIRILWNDYTEMIGGPVPLKQLGFRNFEEYLLSIPDVVHVYGTGPLAEVEPVVSSKSEHISELVARQKKDNRYGRKGFRPKPQYRQRRSPPQHRPSFTPPQNYNRPTLKPSPFKVIHDSLPPFQAVRNPNNAQTFPNSYPPKPNFQTTPPQTFSDRSQAAPIRRPSFEKADSNNIGTSPDVSSFEKRAAPVFKPNFDEPKFHSHSNIQSFPKDSSFEKPTTPMFRPNFEEPKSQTLLDPFKNPTSPVFKPRFDVPAPPTPLNATLAESFSNSFYLPEEAIPLTRPKFQVDAEARLKLRNCETGAALFSGEDSLNFLQVTPRYGNLDFLEEETPPFMKLSQVPSFPVDISPIRDCPTPETVCCKEPEPFPEADPTSEVPIKVQKNLKALIQKFPEGLECSKLPREYRALFNKKISYVDYNFRSVIHMCSNLPKIFHYIQQPDDYVLFAKGKPVPMSPTKGQSTDVTVKSLKKSRSLEELFKVNLLTALSFLPSDVFKMSDEISRFFLSDVEVGHILDISVGEIYDISKFWMYMTFGGLDDLMKELQTFFAQNHSAYKIPEPILEEGLYCISVYDGSYHRCVIVNMLNHIKHYVRVLYIDYGTVCNVNTEELWFLPKQFGELPWQSMRARLSNIYPVFENHAWSAKAVARFEQLVAHRVVVAKVTKIDSKDHVLEVYLADITREDNIFYINDIFVEEGLALYTDQERKTAVVDPDCVPIIRHLHLYPEFYEIEAGLAPTTDEMRYILDNKIPLHIYMPQYFDIYYKDDIVARQLQHRKLNLKRSTVAVPAAVDEPEFDFAYFPDWLADDARKSQGVSVPVQPEPEVVLPMMIDISKMNESDKNAAKQYLTSRKRVLSLKYDIINDKSKVDVCEPCDGSFSVGTISSGESPEVVSVISNLDRVSLNNSGLNNTLGSPRLPDNPFFGDNSSIPTNPFHCTNPFRDLSDSKVTAKPLNDALPQKINNNLKEQDASPCTCKQRKQLNTDKHLSEISDTPSLSTVSTPSPTETVDSGEPVPTPQQVGHRIRTPPGFNSMNPRNPIPFQPAFANFFNCFANANNPYYQRYPVNFPANAFLPLVAPVAPNAFYNNVPQGYPHQFNFNIANFQQVYRPPEYRPRYP